MASIRERARKGGGVTYAVLYLIDGRQSSLSFDNRKQAEQFAALVESVGPLRALAAHGIDPHPRKASKGHTVGEWMTHYIDHLTGLDKRTIDDYRGMIRGPITALPLADLSRDDVARWVQGLSGSGKTIANKHALLSAALAAAVEAGHLPSNPAAGITLPRTESLEMVFLTHQQFNSLIAEIPDVWRPLVRFLVASGARWGEATALKPSDVDRDKGTVRITKAWRRNPYRIAPTKTKKSVRTVNVPKAVLDELDYTREWLFTNPGRGNRAKGGPVRAPNFRVNVWKPAIARAGLDPAPRIHDLRHTYASWMLDRGVPIFVVSRQMGHESIKTTVDRYGHLDRSSFAAAAEVMGDILGAR